MGKLVLRRRPGQSVLLGERAEVGRIRVVDVSARGSLAILDVTVTGLSDIRIVLTQGQAATIGPGITVSLADAIGGQARLAIEAPQTVRIFRPEVLTRPRPRLLSPPEGAGGQQLPAPSLMT